MCLFKMTALTFMWQGFWQGVGFELAFIILLVLWLALYQNHGHKLDAENFLHKLHDYFTK